MWLFQLMRRYRSVDYVSSLAGKVAQNCHARVWSRVAHRVTSMRLHEARGYVRARATTCVQAEVERLMTTVHGLTAEQKQAVIARALEQVVGLVIRDVLVPSRGLAFSRAAA